MSTTGVIFLKQSLSCRASACKLLRAHLVPLEWHVHTGGDSKPFPTRPQATSPLSVPVPPHPDDEDDSEDGEGDSGSDDR